MTDAGTAAPFRGVAVREAARAGARGRVVSVHRKAVYLDLDGTVVALVAADVEPGPLHLRSGPVPPAVAGERVACDGSRIAAGTWAVRCDVPVWEGLLPEAGQPGRTLASGAGIPADVPVDPDAVMIAVGAGAIEELAGLLGGLGPGLTPAGDDLLAGLVLAARARWGKNAEARLGAAVDTVRTTRPAQAFLHWAARGQCLAPAHDVLLALADGDATRAADAATRLDGIGASSGRCLLAGIRIGVAQLPRLDTQSTRAAPEAAL